MSSPKESNGTAVLTSARCEALGHDTGALARLLERKGGGAMSSSRFRGRWPTRKLGHVVGRGSGCDDHGRRAAAKRHMGSGDGAAVAAWTPVNGDEAGGVQMVSR
jgi:hypothetical protein